MKNQTKVERTSEREIVTTRTIDGPARLVFEAWTKPELIVQWWAPKSPGWPKLVSCNADVRVGGKYRFVFGLDGSPEMAFFGRYLEVTPHSRLAWTNEEGEAGESITTLTLHDEGDKTRMVMHELHPSKEALDGVLSSGWETGMCQQFDQLDEFVCGGAGATTSP